jgi:hypothetical protein
MIFKLTHSESQPKINSKFLLNAAIVACFKHDSAAANKILLKINKKILEDDELAWYYAVKSIIFAMFTNLEEMENNLEEAEKHSTSTDQSTQIQAFMIQFLLHLPPNLTVINNLPLAADTLQKKYKLQKGGYPFLKTYTLLLVRSGDNQKAKDVSDEQIANTNDADVQDLQSFCPYRAIAEGLYSKNGLCTIMNLLLSPANDELKKQTLKVLRVSVENANQRMDTIEMLSDAKFQTTTSKSIPRQILLTKTRLSIDAGNLIAAQRIAEEFILQFPHETLIK